MRGYLADSRPSAALADYMNLNFPYLDKLENQVVVETNLQTQIQSMLVAKGFSGVTLPAQQWRTRAGRAGRSKAIARFSRYGRSAQSAQGCAHGEKFCHLH